jgi:hypothetical protein
MINTLTEVNKRKLAQIIGLVLILVAAFLLFRA